MSNSPSTTPPNGDRTRRLRHGLATVPFLLTIGAVPWVNRTHPFVLGLPFFMFWLSMSILLTSACMAVVYRLDPVNRARPETAAEEDAK